MAIPTMKTSDFHQGGIFVPDEISRELNMLIKDASCVEKLARHVPMTRLVQNRRMQTDSARGYWVDALAVKTKDKPEFDSYTLTAEKMAVIVPIEDQLLEDADSNIASIVREDVTTSFAEDLDRTYLGYEPSSPFATSWSGTTPAANTIAFGTGVDLAADFSLAMRAIEVNGFEVTGAVTHPYVKHILRNLRDVNNQPIFAENLRDGITGYSVFGIPICFTSQVAQQASPAGYEILLAYTRYLIIGDRTGLQVSISHEATLTQGTEPDINLFEQDASALRFVVRKGFVVKNEDALAKVTGVV